MEPDLLTGLDDEGPMQPGEPPSDQDLADLARGIIDANRYMTLATADRDGRPWASPVWFAHQGYTEFLWISRPEARHSRNLAVRPELAIVIFDSTVPAGQGQAVYVEAQGHRARPARA
jgi:nitroimidazol reductase NimA-like FMN-containing flavoprotein (pyridoxamine 5'-phosphate oxidase superfamily)